MFYTTKDLAEGKIALHFSNDNRKRLEETLNEAFPADHICPKPTIHKDHYYFKLESLSRDVWAVCVDKNNVPNNMKIVPMNKILLMSEVKEAKKKVAKPKRDTPAIHNKPLTMLPQDLQDAINVLGSYGVPVDIEISINGKKIAL